MSDAELFFYLDLHWQAVRVPASFAFDVKSPHRLIAADDVLEDTREHMMNAGSGVCGRRPFEKPKRLGIFAKGQTFFENSAILPEPQDSFFDLRQRFGSHRISILRQFEAGEKPGINSTLTGRCHCIKIFKVLNVISRRISRSC